MGETLILQQIRLALGSRPDIKLWRNNAGALKDKDGRWVHFGIANPGGSDLIGWVRVGGVAVFLAIEIKTTTGHGTQQQLDFISFVRLNGGRAGVARSVNDAERICNGDVID